MSEYTVLICTECGAQLYAAPTDPDALIPGAPCERGCGTFPQATARSTGSCIEVPGYRQLAVIPRLNDA